MSFEPVVHERGRYSAVISCKGEKKDGGGALLEKMHKILLPHLASLKCLRGEFLDVVLEVCDEEGRMGSATVSLVEKIQ